MDSYTFCETFNIFKLSLKTKRRLSNFCQKFTITKHAELWTGSSIIENFVNDKNSILPSYNGKILISENSCFIFFKNHKIIAKKNGVIEIKELKKNILNSDKFYVINPDIGSQAVDSFKNDLEIVEILKQKVNEAILESSLKKRERLAQKFKIKNTSSININEIHNDKVLYIILKYLDSKFCYL